MSETYTIQVTCSNCDYLGDVDIPRGTEFKNYNNASVVCPTCGCSTLRKATYDSLFNDRRKFSDRKFWLNDERVYTKLCDSALINRRLPESNSKISSEAGQVFLDVVPPAHHRSLPKPNLTRRIK